jgi:hypothetical protein
VVQTRGNGGSVAEAKNNGGCGLWRTSTTSRFETVLLDVRGSDPDPGIFEAANMLMRSEAAKIVVFCLSIGFVTFAKIMSARQKGSSSCPSPLTSVKNGHSVKMHPTGHKH